MSYRAKVVVGILTAIMSCCPLVAQTPTLSNIEAPYPALQGSVHIAGGTYGSGSVAYGAVNTPLILSGANFGPSGTVLFPGSIKGTTVAGTVTEWDATIVFVLVPPGATSGLVKIVVGGGTSNGLPFVVTPGGYAGSCPAYPPSGQLQVTTTSLANGTMGTPYTASLAASGGTLPYTWGITTGALPAGLSLGSDGSIGGTPTVTGGPFNIAVQVRDNSSQTSDAVLSLTVDAQGLIAASIYTYSVPNSGGYDATGNLKQYSDSVMGAWSFNYDSISRLSSASPGSGAPSEYSGQNLCMAYDSFGNRTQSNFESTACSGSDPATASYNVANQVTFTTVNGASNGFVYDTAGNVVFDNKNYYAYDSEGRLCAVQNYPMSGGVVAIGYLYDAEGRRVAKGTIAPSSSPMTQPPSCNPASNGFTLIESYVLGQAGEQLTTLDQNSHWVRNNYYAAGKLIATGDAMGLHYHLTDPLGTRRLQTNAVGQPEVDCQSLPFGDQQYCFPDANAPASAEDSTPLHFTGKERDSESGNDYFAARYYASSMGRFLSPDPAGPWVADVSDPQSWNMYSYARNNPLINVDLFGYDCVYLNDAGTGIDKNGIDTNSNSGECGHHGGYWVDGTFTSGTVYSNNNDVYLHGYDSSTGQLTDSYSNVVTANGSSPINTDVFSGPNLFAYMPTQPLPQNVLNGMVHSLNRSGQSDKVVGCVIAGESSGRSGAAAQPPSTAKGLMQVNNPTAGDIARWYRSDFGGMSGGQLSSQMTDPAMAITAGTDLLSHKIGAGSLANGLGNYYGSNDPSANAAYASGVMGCAQKP